MPFYKLDPDNDQSLFIANLGVDAPDYSITINDKDTYNYPVHGWYYFDSDEYAYAFFGIEYEIT